jgi:hypothetical protein
MFLTEEELIELSGRRRHGYQRRQLDHLGIPYRVRTDGSLIVLRIHVEVAHDPKPKAPRVRLAG